MAEIPTETRAEELENAVKEHRFGVRSITWEIRTCTEGHTPFKQFFLNILTLEEAFIVVGLSADGFQVQLT